MNSIISNVINEIKSTGKETFSKREIVELLEEYLDESEYVPLESNGVLVNPETFTVTVNGVEHILPRKELQLLYFLIENKNKNLSRSRILRSVWGEDVYVDERTVDVHIRKIRKIGIDSIMTNRGTGYRWIDRS